MFNRNLKNMFIILLILIHELAECPGIILMPCTFLACKNLSCSDLKLNQACQREVECLYHVSQSLREQATFSFQA